MRIGVLLSQSYICERSYFCRPNGASAVSATDLRGSFRCFFHPYSYHSLRNFLKFLRALLFLRHTSSVARDPDLTDRADRTLLKVILIHLGQNEATRVPRNCFRLCCRQGRTVIYDVHGEGGISINTSDRKGRAWVKKLPNLQFSG